MKNGAVFVLGLLVIDSPVWAENGVFKCTAADGEMVYQGVPCKSQQQQVTLVEPKKRDPEKHPEGQAANVASDPGERRSVLVGEELEPGMSDTKVLNMRGWGRPQNITRIRAEDGYREEWTYVSRGDGSTRLVSFVNGKVAGIRSGDALQLARARQETQALADQNRRAFESMQVAHGEKRDDARIIRTEGKAIAADTPQRTTNDTQPRVVVAPIESDLNIRPENLETRRDAPNIDHAARAAAAIARIEESRREPLPLVRAEPPLRSPEAAMPSTAVVYSSAERQLPTIEETVTQ